MAGGGEAEDNPLPINVVPMVDIIFCLCVFFMCSFKFRQTEGKFDTWLPKDRGTPEQPYPAAPIVSEVRVAMTWDESSQRVTRRLGHRTYADDRELALAIEASHDAWVATGHPDAPVTIDADSRVPWREVTNVVNLTRARDITKIEFALGAPPRARSVTR